MKSICIKTNNANIIDYLLEDLYNLDLDDVYVSHLSFKIYQNIIIHYKGKNLDYFINSISSILTNTIIIFYENIIINNIINNEYFYFSQKDKKKIKALSLSALLSNTSDYLYNYNCIFNSLNEYLTSNKVLILNGFVAFRIKNYQKSIENLIAITVNDYVAQSEYHELLDIIKLFLDET